MKVGLAKSPNKHNRLFGTVEPLSQELCVLIENHSIDVTKDNDARSSLLINKFGWDPMEAKKKIWCFGPEGNPTNVLVDMTKVIVDFEVLLK
jgi:elongation factor 2